MQSIENTRDLETTFFKFFLYILLGFYFIRHIGSHFIILLKDVKNITSFRKGTGNGNVKR